VGWGVASMAIDQVLSSLSRVPLFTGLQALQITEIGRHARRCAFGNGEVITRAGDPGDGAYLILSGEAGWSAGADGRGPLEPVEPGSVVGELAMFVDHTYGATVVARGWVDCLKLERAALADQMRRDPDIAECIADVIRGRLALLAAELQVIDRLLMTSIEECSRAPRVLPAPSPSEGPPPQIASQAEGALAAP
jgi:CRP-like cAMP-binding protein